MCHCGRVNLCAKKKDTFAVATDPDDASDRQNIYQAKDECDKNHKVRLVFQMMAEYVKFQVKQIQTNFDGCHFEKNSITYVMKSTHCNKNTTGIKFKIGILTILCIKKLPATIRTKKKHFISVF